MRTPKFWYRPSGFISTLLAPFSLLYAAGRALDVFLAKPQAFGKNVICIGNLTAGGAGKTPVALALAQKLQASGHNVQFATRGYGGGDTRIPIKLEAGADMPTHYGDEPQLLARVAPVWVARDRALGIGCALAAGADYVLLDDGLQNTHIACGTNIMVVDGKHGFGNGQLIPAGPLRETLANALKRVHAVIIIGDDAHNVASSITGLPVFNARLVPDMAGLNSQQKYVTFAGIGLPDKFYDSCRAAGLQLVATHDYADHHPYTAEDAVFLQRRAVQLDAQLLTTEKDYTRLPPQMKNSQLAVLPVSLVFDDAARFDLWLEGRR